MKNQLLTLCFCLLVSIAAKAQQDLTLFNFNDIPQSSYSNPANQFNGKFFIGLPAISSSYYSISNSGFAYSDFIKKDGDSLRLDFNSMIAELEETNFLSFNTKIDLLSFGFKLGEKTQLLFNITENVNLRFSYTKDIATFIHKGNGSLAFQDNRANFNGTCFSANYYREYGVGISHQFGNRMRMGARFKYLYGIANLDSRRSDLKLTTDPNTYALTANADVLINTSGSLDSLGDQSGFISGNDNHGFGIDLGMNYELTKKLSINASVIDLGYIDWGSNVTNYNIDKGQYYFDGIEIDAFSPQDDTTGTSAFDRVADSLESAFNVKETNEGYTTPLVGRFYVGANYKLGEKAVIGGLIQSEFFKGSIRPSFTASANYKLTKWIGLAASYSMINRSFNNLGVGININPGPVQIYVVSDNVMSSFQPQHARHAQVRAGINLIFGSEKVREINPSFDGVIDSKRPKKEKKAKEGKEIKEIKQNEPEVTPFVPDTTKPDTIMGPKKPHTPEEKMDSVIQKRMDSVNLKVDSAKTESGKTIIEAVEENKEKITQQTDSIKQTEAEKTKSAEKEMKAPVIDPSPEKVKADSIQKPLENTVKAVEENKEKIKQQTDSIKQTEAEKTKSAEKEMEAPMIHPTPEKVKTDSLQKPLENSVKTVEQKVSEAPSKIDSTLTTPVDSTKLNSVIKTGATPVEEKAKEINVKSDSIPSPAQSVPKKEEPVTEPQ